MSIWKYRWAPTLGRLESTAEKVWGIEQYKPELLSHQSAPVVFFGLYGLPDFYTLWRHKGRKAILWAGTDITHFINGYWLDDKGGIKIAPYPLAEWINMNCESWTENQVEHDALEKLGIHSNICPSFLGDIDDYPLSYVHSDRPKVYASVSGDNFQLYGWHKVALLALQNPDVEFHMYGNKVTWKAQSPNVIVHGRVPKEQMNKEIMQMQGGLRLTEFDGFSEIIAKSVLWGQYPVSLIKYAHVLRPEQLQVLKFNRSANIEGREYYRKMVNNFPWNETKNYKKS